MLSICDIGIDNAVYLKNPSYYQSLEIVDPVSETHFQVTKNVICLDQSCKG